MLVLSRNAVLQSLARPLVAPLTTRVREIPTEVALDAADGVPEACVVSLDNIQPLSKALLIERVTRLRPERMAEVCRALSVAVDCE